MRPANELGLRAALIAVAAASPLLACGGGDAERRQADPARREAKRAAAARDSKAASGAIEHGDWPEPVRQAIYAEAERAVARAADQVPQPRSSDSSPLGPGLVPGPERLAKQELKRKARLEILEAEYRRDVGARHGLSEAQVLEILEEGRAKRWPVRAP